MTRGEAIRRALSKWGERGTVVEDAAAPTEEEKVRLRVQLRERRDDPESMSRVEAEQAINRLIKYRCKVGVLIRNQFVCRGDGDSWEDAFSAAEVREIRYRGHPGQTQSTKDATRSKVG